MPETVIYQGAILAGTSEAKPLSPFIPITPCAVSMDNSTLEARKPRFQETAWYILADVPEMWLEDTNERLPAEGTGPTVRCSRAGPLSYVLSALPALSLPSLTLLLGSPLDLFLWVYSGYNHCQRGMTTMKEQGYQMAQ